MSPMLSLRPGPYAIVDLDALDARELDPLRFADAVLAAHPAALQLRAKHAPHARSLALLHELAPRCRVADVPLVANDHLELALQAKCDALHLGQEDVSPALARQVAPTLPLGVSTHTPEQLSAALARFPWYVAYGPIFTTSSKERPDPVVGVAGLAEAAAIVAAFARAHGGAIPLVAIGGIDLARVEAVAAITPHVAVIGGLLPEGLRGDSPSYDAVTERVGAYASAIARGAAKRGAA